MKATTSTLGVGEERAVGHVVTDASSSSTMAETLLAFKAGRAFRREGTNIVEPSPTKGAIIVSNGDDGLLHFTWKNRTTGVVDEVGPIFIVCSKSNNTV